MVRIVRAVGGGQVLRVHVIDGLGIDGMTERDLGSRKARVALRLLAIAAGRPVSAERMADVLWQDEQPRDPAGQVAVIISRLRSVLGAPRITHGDLGYSLHVDWLDLAAAGELVTEADQRLAAGAATAALAAAMSASALLDHPDLDDVVWSDQERRSVERLGARCRHLMSRAALAAADLATGVEVAEQAMDADPYDEEALRLAMAGLVAQGRSSSALALYERVRTRLDDDLGVSPSAETDAAHRAVLKGLAVPDVAVALRAHGDRASGDHRLVGRDDELQALDDLFRAVATEGPCMVVIDGEPGIGKTALATTWIAGLDPDIAVLDTRCDQVSGVLPLQTALQLLRAFLRRSGGPTARALLGPDGPLLEPLLEWRASGGGASADTAQMLASAAAGVSLLLGAISRVVARVCTSPSVMFIDDVQRADPLTRDWLGELIRTPDLPLLVLLTRRTGGDASLHPGSRIIALSPLSVDSAALLVGDARAGDLHRRSNGNPLFLTELARAHTDVELPESIQSAVVARCAEAGSDAETIRRAAVLGTRVDVDLLGRVVGAEPIQLLGALEHGRRLGLLDERDGLYVFRHGIVQEALERSVDSPRRALIHREAARALAVQPGADPMLIAHHARLSGARDIGAVALTAASRIAAERFDYRTALELAGEAITAADTTPARLQRATVLLRLARYEEARADAEIGVSRGDDVSAYEVAGAIAYYCRDFARAALLGEALVEHAPTPFQQVQGYVVRTRALHAAGDVAGARGQMGAALELCRTHRFRRPASVQAFLMVHMGEAAEAVAAVESSLSSPDESASTIYTPVHVHCAHGYALATLGRAGEALRVLKRASDEAQRRGLVRYASLGRNMSSWVLRNIGEVALAQERNSEARDGAHLAGYRELEVYAVLDPCDDDLASDDVESASRRMSEARVLMGETYAYAWRHELRLLYLEARIALAQGRAQAALDHAAHLVASAVDRSAPRYARLAEVMTLQARAALGAAPASEDRLRDLSAALSLVAGVEAWWLLADLGETSGVALCFELATQHQERLGGTLDPAARTRFGAYADARLDMIRTRGRTG
jgi:DNA-binding SARP family transcriptional activator/tetratricopeptide (TPR) repeat protein